MSVNTSTSDAAVRAAGDACAKLIEEAKVPLLCAFWKGDPGSSDDDDDDERCVKPYWLGLTASKPVKIDRKLCVHTYLFDERTNSDDTGAVWIPQGREKCAHAFGKCGGRANGTCKKWHITALPIDSIVPKVLTGRDQRKYFKPSADGSFNTLSAGWDQKILDEREAAELLCDTTMELL